MTSILLRRQMHSSVLSKCFGKNYLNTAAFNVISLSVFSKLIRKMTTFKAMRSSVCSECIRKTRPPIQLLSRQCAHLSSQSVCDLNTASFKAIRFSKCIRKTRPRYCFFQGNALVCLDLFQGNALVCLDLFQGNALVCLDLFQGNTLVCLALFQINELICLLKVNMTSIQLCSRQCTCLSSQSGMVLKAMTSVLLCFNFKLIHSYVGPQYCFVQVDTLICLLQVEWLS